MKRFLIAVLALAPMLVAPARAAEQATPAAPPPGAEHAAVPAATAEPFTGGDAQAGAAKAATCAACHGAGGVSTNPEWPKLAGQSARYVETQLQLFKAGLRPSPVMVPQAAPLSPQDMKDLGAYFASQAPSPGVASPDSVAKAEKLYRAGHAARGIPACAACHGPGGAGNAGAAYPRIGGQHSTYTAHALRELRAVPVDQLPNQAAVANVKIMATVAARLSDAEIDALAAYVAGLQ